MVHDYVDSPRHVLSNALRFVSAWSFLGALVLGVISACGDPPPAKTCVGGLVTPEGVCEPKCSNSKCLPGNICVDNRCVLECTSHGDCLDDGTQNCAPAKEDDTGRATMTCQSNSQSFGIGLKCPFGDECGNVHACSTTGERCDPAQCNGAPDTCKLDEKACFAKANCHIGTCPDGSACTKFSCTAQECTANLTCITKGDADADAYCTKTDCDGDADCPGGYYCGAIRDPRELCDSMPKKGNSNLCGTPPVGAACVPASDLGKDNTLFEGQRCILRKACLKRNECAPCATDLDCSTGIANHCITMPMEAQKRCAKECVTSLDCGRDHICQDLDGTTKVCVHRTGACVGSGKFCEPCLDDTDCGPLTGTSVCFTHNDGQRGCADTAFPTPCMSDADCPKSPSGAPGFCYDDPASPIYQHCYIFAYIDVGGGDLKATCW